MKANNEPRASLRLTPKRLISLAENIYSDSTEKWTVQEMKALAEFILFPMPVDKWPSHKQSICWESASKFVEHRVKSPPVCRSVCQHTVHSKNCTIHVFIAEVCQCKVTGYLAKR